MPILQDDPSARGLLAGPAPQSARRLVRQQLAAMRAALVALEADPADAPALHRLRVGARHCRSLLRGLADPLRGARPRRLARLLGAQVDHTGAQRDHDVMQAALDACIAALPARQRRPVARHRAALLPHVPSTLPDAERFRTTWHQLLDRIERATATWRASHRADDPVTFTAFAPVLADAIAAALARLDTRLAALTDDAPEAEHAARIAGKRLRYLIQPFSKDDAAASRALAALKALQDILGERRDAHLLLAALASVAQDTTQMHAGRGRSQAARARALATVQAALVAHRATLAADLAPWRTGAALAALRTDLAEFITAAIAPPDAPPVEIERKYLLSALPPRVRAVTPMRLRQGYLPGTAVLERIRAIHHDGRVTWKRTVKVGSGVSRLEFEERTTPAIGRALYALTAGRRVEKRRYAIPDGALVWEIDEFTDRALVLAEVELPDAGAVVTVPEWLRAYVVRDVTDDPAFTNAALAH